MHEPLSYKLYLGDLIGGSLMLRESQIIAELLLSYPTSEEWHDKIVNQNILQKNSDASSKRNASTLKNRINCVSDEIKNIIAFGSGDDAKQAMFASVLINTPILYDFMKDVVIDAKRIFRQTLDQSDWEHFWEERSRLHPELGEMTQSTTYKIKQVTFKLLADAEYIDTSSKKNLQNVYVSPRVKDSLSLMGREDVADAMELN
jgi:hypothetical protein